MLLPPPLVPVAPIAADVGEAAVADIMKRGGKGLEPDDQQGPPTIGTKPVDPQTGNSPRAKPSPERMEPTGSSGRTGNSSKSDVFQPSVTGTNSTFVHMNLSTETFMKRDSERRQAREEKKEDPDRSGFAQDGIGMDPIAATALDATAQCLQGKGQKTTLEEERARQVALVALAQQQTNPGDPSGKAGSPKKGGSIPNVQRNDSGVSLEYSVDSSILVGGDSSILGGGSTLLGQNFAGDTSVMSTSSRGSRRVQPGASQTKMASLLGKHDELSADSLSLQDDSSSWDRESVVPADDELFAVGWAKALDPKSGSYYYFTLDRSKIVWDNPLAGSISRRGTSGDTGDSDENIPAGAAVI